MKKASVVEVYRKNQTNVPRCSKVVLELIVEAGDYGRETEFISLCIYKNHMVEQLTEKVKLVFLFVVVSVLFTYIFLVFS